MAGVGCLVAEAASGENRLNRHAVINQRVTVAAVNGVLRGRRLRLEQLPVVQIISILHVACRMEFGDVERLEALVVRHDLGVILDREAHRFEYLLALALHQRDGVIGAAGQIRRHGEVKLRQRIDFALKLLRLERLQLFRKRHGDGSLELVRLASDRLFHLIGHRSHALEGIGHLALAPEVADAERLKIDHAGNLLQLRIKAVFQRFDFFVHSGFPPYIDGHKKARLIVS